MSSSTYYLIVVCLTIGTGLYSEGAKVSETTCTATGNECPTNSKCDTTVGVLKCKCSQGYQEEKASGETCVKIIGLDCKNDEEICSGDANAECKGESTAKSCECKTGYIEKEMICVKESVTDITCTGGEDQCKDIANAECDAEATEEGHCKCSDGFTMNVDKCSADNAGIPIQLSISTLLISFTLFWLW